MSGMNVSKIVVAALLLMMGAVTGGSGLAWAQKKADAPPARATLYERMGGLRTLTVVVDDFVDRMLKNKELNRNAAVASAKVHAPTPYLKFQMTQLFCQQTGGPCRYAGKGMKESHAHLKITEREWTVMISELRSSLTKFRVSEPEQKEVLELVGRMKADVVSAPGVATSGPEYQ